MNILHALGVIFAIVFWIVSIFVVGRMVKESFRKTFKRIRYTDRSYLEFNGEESLILIQISLGFLVLLACFAKFLEKTF